MHSTILIRNKFFFFQAEDGIRDYKVTGVQTCALPISRMKLTKGSGLWPAFWMLPTPNPDGTYHDGDGEIDIMEQVGTDPTRTEAHLHHNGTSGKSFDTGLDLSAGFHTYGLDWQADH